MEKINGNVEQKKQEYRRTIFQLVRTQQPISRYQLKQLSHYSMTTTLAAVEELLACGAIVEAGTGESTGGRKPNWLKVNPGGGFFLGIEFNAQQIISIIMDLSGTARYIDHCILTPEQRQASVVVEEIKRSIRNLLNRLPEGANLYGIGLGVPGFVDIERGISLDYALIKDWINIDIKQQMQETFHVPVFIENNVNTMALAYKWNEFNGDCDNLVYIILRAGIRLGSIINNNLFSGFTHAAGEVDHMRVTGDRLCHCGQRGCFVSEASITGIMEKIDEGIRAGRFQPLLAMVEGNAKQLQIQHFIDCVLQNDPECNAVLNEAARAVGEVLTNVVMIQNPSEIIISSPLTRCGARFLHRIQEELQVRCPRSSLEHLNVKYCGYSDHIGALGAASLAMQNFQWI